jgi:hypothetical protein
LINSPNRAPANHKLEIRLRRFIGNGSLLFKTERHSLRRNFRFQNEIWGLITFKTNSVAARFYFVEDSGQITSGYIDGSDRASSENCKNEPEERLLNPLPAKMASQLNQIYIFGKEKVNLLQFVAFNCNLASSSPYSVKLSRVFRGDGKNFRVEPTVATAGVSNNTKSIHISDIFLTPQFGLCVEFSDKSNNFASDDTRTKHDLISIINANGEELHLLSWAKADRVK